MQVAYEYLLTPHLAHALSGIQVIEIASGCFLLLLTGCRRPAGGPPDRTRRSPLQVVHSLCELMGRVYAS